MTQMKERKSVNKPVTVEPGYTLDKSPAHQNRETTTHIDGQFKVTN